MSILHKRLKLRIFNHVISLSITTSCGRALIWFWKQPNYLYDRTERYCEIRFSRRLFLQIVIYRNGE